jgi:anthranilate synthase component 1
MVYPKTGEFRTLAKQGTLVPVYREILADMHTPVSAFKRLGKAHSFLLESVEGGEKWARYSFLGVSALKTIVGRGGHVEVTDKSGTTTHETDDPIQFLRELMSAYTPVRPEGLPRFYGGLVGYIGYDTVRFIEKLPEMAANGLPVPDMFLMLTDTMLIFDSLRQTIKVVSNVHMSGRNPDELYAEAVAKISDVIDRLNTPADDTPAAYAGEDTTPAGRNDFVSSFGKRGAFKDAVLRAKEYIRAGDIFQVVLSQRFERRTNASPFNIYRALRVINPSPYMYYLDIGDTKLVGSSPEILVRREGDLVTLKPIAGTRKRGGSDREDSALEAEMKADPKEIAEHIMLLDLGRNDVGRVAETGSVSVTDMLSVEKYSHVMHMVSNVEGRLKEKLDSFDVLRACFPAGTVSGAPKVRAMEIIEELEPVRRGPYAGAVGYFSFSGNMDTCITIRTLIIRNGYVYVQAGAGIVADSIPENEYMETVNKAMGMMKAVDMAENVFERD